MGRPQNFVSSVLWILIALHELGVRGHGDGGDHLVGDELDRLGGRVDADLLRLAVEIAGRDVPVLPFPLVVVHPHGVAVGALELGVDVDERLHEVVAGRQVLQARHRRAQIGRVDDGGLSRRQVLDVAAEERRAGAADLQARLALVGARDHEVDAAGDRLLLHRWRHGDLDAHPAIGGLGRAGAWRLGGQARGEAEGEQGGDGDARHDAAIVAARSGEVNWHRDRHLIAAAAVSSTEATRAHTVRT